MTNTDKRSYPLRKILYTKANTTEGIKDYLECGHKLSKAQDIYGNYYPVKRRCFKCAKGKEKEFIIDE